MSKIKVIHIITRFDKGGSAENTFLTVMNLDREKYDVRLIKGMSLESSMGEEERKAAEHNLLAAENAGVIIETLPRLLRNVHPINDLIALGTLIRLIRRERPHIVHTHTSKAGILGRWAAWFSNVPVIIHTPHGHVFWGYFNRFLSFIFMMLERLTSRVTDKIIALTEQEKIDHVRHRIAPEDKFEVIHSGVNLDNFRDIPVDVGKIKKDLRIPVPSFVVGTAGRLTEIKGHRYLVEAAKNLIRNNPEFHLVFLGDGELFGDLKMTASRLNLEKNVHFAGWKSNVAEIMSTFDLFILPSLNEGMGRVLVEAMALGKPVIASAVGGILDLVEHGKNGLLVPPADSCALEKTIELLMNDANKMRSLCEEGKRTSESYNAAAMVRKIDHLYVQLTAERGYFSS